MSDRLYLSPPALTGGEWDLIKEALQSNWIAPLGPHVAAFEEEFAKTVGVGHAAATCSGTAALHLAVKLAGVKPGDEVICSTFTFAATANVVLYEKARPVFIDSDRSTWNIDPALLEEELAECARRGRLPKAVIAVAIYGQSPDYDRILSVCRTYGVPLIEDACQSLGARYRDKPVGGFGLFAAFSFNGNKIITTSGGGMLVSDDREAIERARFLASQAREGAPGYVHKELGYNYRLSNLLAALGRAQLRTLPERIQARRRNYNWYRERLSGMPGISFMPEAPYGSCTRWLTCITVDPEAAGFSAQELAQALARENIETRPLWRPLHTQPLFGGYRVRGGAVAEDLFKRGLALPSGHFLTEGDVDRVCDVVRRLAAQGGGGRTDRSCTVSQR